ncbi:PREDICTED: uncharacterized protein CG1785 [Ceratosolen solmsi marchali]|uniref:Ribosome biogenesis protein NOP53 n=1 Tax=Ceratosolen solmsi marchali TaxID=326594 RepID=A0AAJ7DYK7_9HYME|nr:PREDICTED: uncharacterized protein CG1785 [Ceratosolen solmsi marchali]
MLDSVCKKHKRSKKTKKSWRKHADIKDVDNFLDNLRLEERLGNLFSHKKNEELFTVDKNRNTYNPIKNNNLTKSQYRELLNNLEPNCFAILKSFTAVPDPIVKRNCVKTKEKKKNYIFKQLKNQLNLKDKILIQNELSIQINKPKRDEFNIDIWKEKSIEFDFKNGWLNNNTRKHLLRNSGERQKRIPISLYKKSLLPSIIMPHPGTSYNPSYIDHKNLLLQIAMEEMKLIKEEKHLSRVTKKVFHKQTNDNDLSEMSEGLCIDKGKNYITHNENSEQNIQSINNLINNEDSEQNIQSINNPIKNSKKSLIQRRRQKEQQNLQQQQLKQKVEKKKIVDIYHLNNLKNQIIKTKKKEKFLHEKRLKMKAKRQLEPKILSKNKFEPLEQEFQIEQELSGNLWCTQPIGSLLKERYKSLQQRNIIAPGRLVL